MAMSYQEFRKKWAKMTPEQREEIAKQADKATGKVGDPPKTKPKEK